jgi:hypothetical protein
MEHSFFRGAGPGASPMTSVGGRQTPSRALWRSAKIRAVGTVNFFGEVSRWYAFEVSRAQLLHVWPAERKWPAERNPRDKAKPISDAIRDAINDLWPKGVPHGLRPKERNNQIAEWLNRNGKSVPNSDPALARAIQREMKSSA